MRAIAVFFVLLGALFASQSAQLRALLVSQSFPVVGELYGVDIDGDGKAGVRERIYLDLATGAKCFAYDWHAGRCTEHIDMRLDMQPAAYIVKVSPERFLYLDTTTQEVAPIRGDTGIVAQRLHNPLSDIAWKIEDGAAYFVYKDFRNFPSLISRYDTPGFVWDVERVGDTLYVADGVAGLQVFDIAGQNLLHPRPIAQRALPGEAIEVHSFEGRIYVGTKDAIHIFDADTLASLTAYDLPADLYFFRPTPYGLFVALVDGSLLRITAEHRRLWRDFDAAYITPRALYRYDQMGLVKLTLPHMRPLRRFALGWGEVAAVGASVGVATKEGVEIARGQKVYALQLGFSPTNLIATKRYFYLLDSIARMARIDPRSGASEVLYVPYPATDIVPYKRNLAIIGQGGAGFIIMKLK